MANEKRNCNQICPWNDPSDGCVRPKGRVCPLSNTEPDASGWGQVQENKKRLIDANALIAQFDDSFKSFVLERIIDAQPIVDAVEVVRCRDCEFCKYNSSSEKYKCMSMNGMYGTVDPDGFCSYGERKDNERKAD